MAVYNGMKGEERERREGEERERGGGRRARRGDRTFSRVSLLLLFSSFHFSPCLLLRSFFLFLRCYLGI